jgi:leucyl aminopeptidase
MELCLSRNGYGVTASKAETGSPMSSKIKISFAEFGASSADLLVGLTTAQVAASPELEKVAKGAGAIIERAAKVEAFKGKPMAALNMLAPESLAIDRLILMGLGDEKDIAKLNAVMLGGAIAGKMASGKSALVLTDWENGRLSAEQAADLALGMTLRDYSFDKYKTKKKDGENETSEPAKVTILVSSVTAAKKAWKEKQAIAEGVILARDLVNEPPNVLFPISFAEQASALEKLGVEIDVLDEKALKKLGMRALLGVGQGSVNESRVVIMRWNGAKDESQKPIAFIGKGVTFDTGGISIKPAAGMEDMKGDMAGAAAVVGLMHTLASRKAKANVIGAIGLVENMPDGKAQRPGDIVKSMSGQTIEMINTDAEGRLVLADVIWHVQDKYKPAFMINLATLTGAILVALAQEYAGIFSNNDELAERLFKSGEATGEKVWRLPLSPEYDKMMDSKVADMKNAGGRYGGSITAAQFIQRFVNNVPWVHIDIAGTAMGSPSSEINKGWASGYGVRLLNDLVAAHYEG